MREMAGRHGEIGGRAAQRALHFTVRAFQTIECYRTYNE